MIAAVPFMLPFRFLHIVAGVLWVGSAFLFAAFLGPSAAEVGPGAMPLLTVMVKKRKVHKVITYLAMTTVTAGWIMWLRDLTEIDDFLGGRLGQVLTIGAVLATVAFFVGYYGVGKNVEKLVDLGGEMGSGDGPPAPEKMAAMQHVGAELEKHSKIDLVLLLLAVTAMSTARYW